ncbi:MAG TPA: murein biosynthesis integral membrane protein MurJ [Miltoncostaea sp.]|nr:murein biosynthesis integral membrane protein MurJ [Miltoncostaea sp.]
MSARRARPAQPGGGETGRGDVTTGLGRSTAVFGAWTGVSRIAGLIREIVAAAIFGTSGAISAFVVAFNVPNLLRSLVADSALSAAFVPVFTELEEQGRKKEAQRLVGAFIGLITMVLGLITLLAIIFAPWLMPLFAPGLDPALVDETVRLARIMFPIVVLLGLTGLVAAVLQAGGRFAITAFVPVLWNVVIIAGLVVVTPFVPDDDRITVYAVAIVVGTVAQLLYMVPAFRREGHFPFSLDWRGKHVRQVLVLMLPVTLGLGLININLTVDTIFATLVSDQAPRAIDAAFRLYLLPQGVFSVAISTVLFPAISRLAARDDMDGMRSTIARGLRQIFFMLLPASAFLLVLSEPVVRLVYQRGQFDAESTALTSKALVFFAIGLAFNGASLLVIRAFFSLQQPWLATKVAALGVVLNAVFDAIFYKPLGTGGIPLATSLSSLITFSIMLWLLDRELGGVHRAWVADGAVRSLVASGVSALFAWAVWRVLDDALGRGEIGQIISVGMAVAAGVVAYLAAAQAFDMGELRAVGRLRRPLP